MKLETLTTITLPSPGPVYTPRHAYVVVPGSRYVAGWLETRLRALRALAVQASVDDVPLLQRGQLGVGPTVPVVARRGCFTEDGTLTGGWRNTCAAAKERAEAVEDLYTRLKTLQRQLEFCDIQEEYIKDETKNLRRELLRAQEEVKRIQSVPLVVGQFLEMVDANSGIVGSTTGSNYYVRILSTLDRELLKPSASVALHRHSNALVDILPPEADSSISLMQSHEKPDVSYAVCCPP